MSRTKGHKTHHNGNHTGAKRHFDGDRSNGYGAVNNSNSKSIGQQNNKWNNSKHNKTRNNDRKKVYKHRENFHACLCDRCECQRLMQTRDCETQNGGDLGENNECLHMDNDGDILMMDMSQGQASLGVTVEYWQAANYEATINKLEASLDAEREVTKALQGQLEMTLSLVENAHNLGLMSE